MKTSKGGTDTKGTKEWKKRLRRKQPKVVIFLLKIKLVYMPQSYHVTGYIKNKQAVDIVIGLRAGHESAYGSILGRGERFLPMPQSVQKESGSHPSSNTFCPGGAFRGHTGTGVWS